jgi:xylose isomerase
MVTDLATPTLAPGETYDDLLADRSAFEDFNPDIAGAQGYGVAHLDQLAVEHVLGARG